MSLKNENWSAIIKKQPIQGLAQRELPEWLSYEIGGGRAVKTAAKAYAKKTFPWHTDNKDKYFNAAGNGTIMREYPLIWLCSSYEDAAKIFFESAMITHGHPRGIIGAVLYGIFLIMIVQNETHNLHACIDKLIAMKKLWGNIPTRLSWIDINDWKRATPDGYGKLWTECVDAAEKTLLSLKHLQQFSDKEALKQTGCFSAEKGCADIAFFAALIFFFRYRGRPIEGIKCIGSMSGIDTDTVACVLGGALGLDSGYDSISSVAAELADYDYLSLLCECLQKDSTSFYEASKKDIKTQLKNAVIGTTAQSSVFGRVTVANIEQVRVLSDTITCRKVLCDTQEGQRITIKYFAKVK